MHRRSIARLGLLAVRGGCDSTDPRPEPVVEFVEEALTPFGGRPDSVGVTGGAGEILLSGLLTIPQPL